MSKLNIKKIAENNSLLKKKNVNFLLENTNSDYEGKSTIKNHPTGMGSTYYFKPNFESPYFEYD